jgi:serine protease AprX
MDIRARWDRRRLAGVASALLLLTSGPFVNATAPANEGQVAPAIERPEGREKGGAGKRAKLSRVLSRKARAGASSDADMVDVIVAFHERPAGSERAFAAQHGGQDRRGYRKFPFRAMRVPANRLEALADNPRVKYVSADHAVSAASPPARETARVPGSTWWLMTPNIAHTGDSVTVAVVDSGVFQHGDYDYTLQGQFDFVNGAAGRATSLSDGFGHGTHIAGMIAADGYYSSGRKYRGVTTQAKVVSLRVLDSQGRGKVSDLIAALDWIVDVGKPQHGIRVANLSLGKSVDEEQASDPLVQAVDAVWDAGVVVVVSAGNYGGSGHYTVTSPGVSRKVITVGSLTDNGTGSTFADDFVSAFSSRGPTLYDHVLKPDLLAPGNRVISTFAEGATLASLLPGRTMCGVNGYTCNWRYMRLSGTSMATAVVSAAVARMLDKDPTLNPATVKARLMKTARKISGDATITGAGVLDVESAMNASGRLTGQALSPLVGLSADGTRVYVEDPAMLWGAGWSAGSLWPNGSLWSNGYLWSQGYLWSDAALWSNGYLWANGSLWPNSSLWANGSLWSDGYLWSEYTQPSSAGVEDPSGPETSNDPGSSNESR